MNTEPEIVPKKFTTIKELIQEMGKEKWYEKIKYWPARIWNSITQIKSNVILAFQRMFRGWDDSAYWNLDGYLTEIALPVLKYYREEGHGVPYNHEHIPHPGEDPREGMHTEESWNIILDKMIKAFQMMHDDDYESEMNGLNPDRRKEIQEGLQLFAEYYQALWD